MREDYRLDSFITEDLQSVMTRRIVRFVAAHEAPHGTKETQMTAEMTWVHHELIDASGNVRARIGRPDPDFWSFMIGNAPRSEAVWYTAGTQANAKRLAMAAVGAEIQQFATIAQTK